MRALRSFASVFKLGVGDLELSVDPEPGVADSGNFEYDLTGPLHRHGRGGAGGRQGLGASN